MNLDKYHLGIAQIGGVIMAIALGLELYHNIDIYKWILVFCVASFMSILIFKDFKETIFCARNDEKT